jgi:hypothetical protein
VGDGALQFRRIRCCAGKVDMKRALKWMGMGAIGAVKRSWMWGILGVGILAAAIGVTGQIGTQFEFFVVSGAGNSVPQVLNGTTDAEDSLNVQICEALEQGRSVAAIAKDLHLPPAEVQSHIDAFANAGLLTPDAAGSYTPTFPIFRRADAEWLAGIDPPVIEATVRAIEARKEDLNAQFRGLLHLNEEQARELSLVLYGDVLFDRWQTKNVRTDFLPGYPPPRDGKLFYVAGLENDGGPIAPLGIYSHDETKYGDATVITYGHASAQDPFAAEKPDAVLQLIAAYVAFAKGGGPVSPELERIGFVRDGKPQVTVISKSEYAALPQITGSFTDTLLGLLKQDRPKIVAAHERSRWAKTVSFQEFALWWYHFYGAAVVDALIRDGVIVVPKAGYATLIVDGETAGK